MTNLTITFTATQTGKVGSEFQFVAQVFEADGHITVHGGQRAIDQGTGWLYFPGESIGLAEGQSGRQAFEAYVERFKGYTEANGWTVS